MKKSFMSIRNASFVKERNKMMQIEKDGVCPFCQKYFNKYHTFPIIKETENWWLSKNDFPYSGSKLHLLIVYKKHIENISKISLSGSRELISIIKFAEKKFKITNGIFLIRFGDTKNTGATIRHLHGHLVVSKGDKKSKAELRTQMSF